MIDAINISNFNLTDDQLEENILFWVCAAGKNGVVSARLLNTFLDKLYVYKWEKGKDSRRLSPFGIIRESVDKLENKETGEIVYGGISFFQQLMKIAGIGNHSVKSQAFVQLAYSGLNLRTCTIDDLEKIKGIGPKTSRAFILHTRPNQRVAAVDTHLLKFLKDNGVQDVPKSTPAKGKTYRRLEEAFLTLCDQAGRIPVEYDLEIWNHYRLKKGPMYVNG